MVSPASSSPPPGEDDGLHVVGAGERGDVRARAQSSGRIDPGAGLCLAPQVAQCPGDHHRVGRRERVLAELAQSLEAVPENGELRLVVPRERFDLTRRL
jgi:hypothetical protein